MIQPQEMCALVKFWFSSGFGWFCSGSFLVHTLLMCVFWSSSGSVLAPAGSVLVLFWFMHLSVSLLVKYWFSSGFCWFCSGTFLEYILRSLKVGAADLKLLRDLRPPSPGPPQPPPLLSQVVLGGGLRRAPTIIQSGVQ